MVLAREFTRLNATPTRRVRTGDLQTQAFDVMLDGARGCPEFH